MTRAVLAAGAVALAAGNAAGQANGWILEVEYMPGSGGVVSPAFPEATVRLLAKFDAGLYFAFAGGDGDVVAQEGTWSDLRLLDVQDPPAPQPPGTTAGLVVGSRVELYIVGQLWFPPAIMPSTANPIPLWEGVWSTEDFSTRSVGVETGSHARFAGYGPHAPPVPPWLIEPGSASIAVVPAPGAGVAFGVLGLLSLRRVRAAGERKVCV
jgi:hypothetical protein